MASIVTLTLSPCIDKSAAVPLLVPERKLRCSSVKLEPGGGGINVVRAIKKLGGDALAIFPSGGYTGKFLAELIQRENLSSIIINTVGETRENIIIFDESTHKQYRFGMPANSMSEHEWKECLDAVHKEEAVDFIVVCGSLPPGVSLQIFAQLKRIAQQKNAKLVIDTSGEALKEAVSHKVYLIKPNLAELFGLAGVNRIEIERAEEIAKSIIRKYRCEVIVVSLGKDGALLVTQDESYKVIPPAVTVKSTVGAGDSMVAGIVYSLAKGSGMLQALQYGVACGTAATMNLGTELCRKKDADELYNLIKGSHEQMTVV
jgi:6-phosphofructokinase 2